LFFAVIGVFFTRPQWQVAAQPFTAVMLEGEVLARVVHFTLASLAVTGTFMLLYALRRQSNDHENGPKTDDRARVAVWGGRIALVPTLLQWPAGLYLLLQLPNPSRDALLGYDWLGTALFVSALLAAVLLMHKLAALALGQTKRKELLWAVLMMVAVVVLMVGARHRARQRAVLGDSLALRELHTVINPKSECSSIRCSKQVTERTVLDFEFRISDFESV
jgi:hypothetical protein